MKVLSKYLLKELIKISLICQIVFLTVYLIIDFLGKIDNFIEADVPGIIMFSYFILKTPHIIVQLLPPATLISVIIMLCLMKNNNEIIAMKAGGINIFTVCRSLIIYSLFLTAALFIFSESIVRYTSSKSNEIWNVEVEKYDPGRYYYGSEQIWYRGVDCIYWIKSFDNKAMIMKQPSFFFFNKNFRLVKKIVGRSATWQDGNWNVEEGIIQELQDDGNYRLTRFSNHYMKLPETPETFIRKTRSPEEMSFRQLKKYAERVRNEGYDNTKYLVEMHTKIAFPFIIFIMTLVGVTIALTQKKVKIHLAVSIGMGICFIYILIFGFSRSLGLSGILPPILSAWFANLAFFLFSIYMMTYVER